MARRPQPLRDGGPVDGVALDRAGGHEDVVDLGAGRAQGVIQGDQRFAGLVAALDVGRLHVDRDTALDQAGDDVQGADGQLVRVQKVRGQLQALAPLHQLQVGADQVVHPAGRPLEEQLREVGDRAGGEAQGADVGHLGQLCNGVAQGGLVHEGIAAGEHDLFDLRHLLHIGHGLLDVGLDRRDLVAALLVFAEAEAAVDRAGHIHNEDDPVAVHLLDDAAEELPDPCVGLSLGGELVHEGVVLVRDGLREAHLAHRAVREPHRVGVQHLLHGLPFLGGHPSVGQLLQPGDPLDGDEALARHQHLQHRQQQVVG